MIDYDLLENFNKVFVSIINNHDLSLIVGWFNENKNLLNKINSNLEFEINYCKFLTLIEKVISMKQLIIHERIYLGMEIKKIINKPIMVIITYF